MDAARFDQLGYTPDSAHVPVGTTVAWSNVGRQPHTVEEYGDRFN